MVAGDGLRRWSATTTTTCSPISTWAPPRTCASPAPGATRSRCGSPTRPASTAARPWPLVHNIHGGPHGVSGDQWHWRWNTQVFAAAGYVVAAVNFHGSSSWTNEFARGIQGAWGDEPTADVLAATDHLLARGFVDPERLAIAGGSYGGYLVAWLIGQTDRFKAAICHAGVTNLLGQYATDVTHGRAATPSAVSPGRHGGHPPLEPHRGHRRPRSPRRW